MGREPTDKANLTVRMQEKLRKAIEDAASKNGESLNSEIVRRLEQSLEREKQDSLLANYVGSKSLLETLRGAALIQDMLDRRDQAKKGTELSELATRLAIEHYLFAFFPPVPTPANGKEWLAVPEEVRDAIDAALWLAEYLTGVRHVEVSDLPDPSFPFEYGDRVPTKDYPRRGIEEHINMRGWNELGRRKTEALHGRDGLAQAYRHLRQHIAENGPDDLPPPIQDLLSLFAPPSAKSADASDAKAGG
jgi:hypothetical protein